MVEKLHKKGISNVIATFMIIFIVLVLLVPFIFYFSAMQSSRQVSSAIINNYQFLKNLEEKEVITGHPAIYYNGSIVILAYTNGTFFPPENLTIVKIMYLNKSNVWVELPLNYPIVISKDQTLKLPSYVVGRPIIIITSLGNIFFLTPGSSIGPISVAGNKAGVIIITEISNSTETIGVSTNITTNIYGKWENFTTPVQFPNTSGTFAVKVPEYVYYQNSKGQIITGVFHNWAVIGKAALNNTNSTNVKITLQGLSTVIIANYTPVLTKVNLSIITNFNGPVTVSVDGVNYSVTLNKNITVPAGYVNITVYTLQGNYTVNSNVIKHYRFYYINYSGIITKATSMIIFVPPKSSTIQKVYINYLNDYNYYNVTLLVQYVNWAQNDYQQEQISIGGVLYNYSKSYWFIGSNVTSGPYLSLGNYTISPVSTFYQYNLYSYGPWTVEYIYSNGTTFTYQIPNLPSYVIIDQPMTIYVYYNVTINWYPL